MFGAVQIGEEDAAPKKQPENNDTITPMVKLTLTLTLSMIWPDPNPDPDSKLIPANRKMCPRMSWTAVQPLPAFRLR